jgi:hypothetical protein
MFNYAIRSRIDRALEQRLFVIDRNTSDNEQCEVFAIQGSRGDIYTCKFCAEPSCNCPDFKRGGRCKHLFFIYLRVMRMSADDPLLAQKSFTEEDLDHIKENAPQRLNGSVLAEQFVRDKYKTFVEKAGKPYTKKKNQPPPKRKSLEGECCPVCYEDFEVDQISETDFCRQCTNNIHNQCWKMWKAKQEQSGEEATCVYCRSPNMGIKLPKSSMGSGYVNVNQLF